MKAGVACRQFCFARKAAVLIEDEASDAGSSGTSHRQGGLDVCIVSARCKMPAAITGNPAWPSRRNRVGAQSVSSLTRIVPTPDSRLTTAAILDRADGRIGRDVPVEGRCLT
jgi:hypothetical protein